MLFVPHNKKETEQAYILIYNYKRKKQVIWLMITDDGKNGIMLLQEVWPHCLEK